MNKAEEEYKYYVDNLVAKNEKPMTPDQFAEYYFENPYFYYRDIKMKGSDKAMTEEEFREQVEIFKQARDKQYTPEELEKIRNEQAKAMFEGKDDFLDIASGHWGKIANPIKNKFKARRERKAKAKANNRKKNKAAKKSRRNNRK